MTDYLEQILTIYQSGGSDQEKWRQIEEVLTGVIEIRELENASFDDSDCPGGACKL